MSEQAQSPATIPQPQAAARSVRMGLLSVTFFNWSSLVFAILQSACTAVIAISGLRVAIGLSALAAAAGIHAPARGFHQDAIRIPMMVLAFLGAVVNLYVIGKLRRFRRSTAAQWRRQTVTMQKHNCGRFIIALFILTFLLLAAVWLP